MEFVFTLASLLLLGSLALFATSRNVRRAVWWGGSLGVVFGLWLLAPMSLRAHALYPQGVLEWSVIVGVLATLFLVIGTFLSLLSSWPLAAAEWLPGRNFRNAQAATFAWTMAVLPLAYLGLAAGLEWSVFPHLPLREGGLAAIVMGAVGVALWIVACWLLYRVLSGGAAVPSRWVAACILAACVAGLVRLVVQVESASPSLTADLPALGPRRPTSQPRPLLVIGLDGGNWRTLDPLIEQGRVPTLARLAGAGVRGQIEALWPPYWSTPAWGSITTGYHQDELGVYENLGATAPTVPSFELPLAPSLPMNPLLLFDYSLLNAGVIDAAPADRRRLRRPPVWERLANTGVRTAVVYFPFTYPAVGQAEWVVSNRAVADIWDMMGIRPGEKEQLVSSHSTSVNLLASLDEPPDSREALSRLLPGIESAPATSDAVLNPPEVLRRALDVGERMFKMTDEIVRADPDLDLVLLYVGDFDSVSHAFWHYRFPEDYPDDPPSPADISRLGPVLDRYLEHVDRRIGELIASFPTPPNVLIVSDHGMQASQAVKLWKAWHSRFGMFVVAGPDVQPQHQLIDVSYLDVVPTILELLEFERPAGLRGRSVLSQPH